MDIDDDNNNEAKYTVYISFDSNDSSISSFINYLRDAFSRHGIYELDDEKDYLFKQIRVLVAVFSSNYKFSMPENLVNHLNKKDLVVVPVLHGVTESAVKQQITELEPSSSVNQVTMWPSVLLESAELSNHVYNDALSESKFMEDIANDVFEKVYPTEEIGIHEQVLDIEDLLCKQPWGTRTLGILGERGVGKTTLTKALFRRMSSGYDVSCFINEYTEKRLGEEYFEEVPMEGFDDQNNFTSEPSKRRKRVLIVLDDVQNANEAALFLGGLYGPGSLIIVISRDKKVLDECHVNEIYELKGLNQEDALKLFTRCAYGKDVTDQDILDLSIEEIKDANGNPSTIRAHANLRKMQLQQSSVSVADPYEEDLQSRHSVDFICLMRDVINFTCQVIALVKAKMSTIIMYKSYLMCIVMPWVFGWILNFEGQWEGLGFIEQTLIYGVLVWGYLYAFRLL